MPAQVASDVVAVLSFTLTDPDDGSVLEQTGPGQSFAYLHGHGNLPEALEAVVEDLSIGDAFDSVVPDAFGPPPPADPQPVQKRDLPKDVRKKLAPGLRFSAQGSDGTTHTLWVERIQGSRAFVTTSHPLAGRTLRFSGQVHALRDPTTSELDHGHAHGAGGQHHAH